MTTLYSQRVVFCVGNRLDTSPHLKARLMKSGARLRQELGGSLGRTAPKANYGRIWPNGNFSLGQGASHQEALELCSSDEEAVARWGAAGDLSAAVAALTSSNGTNPHSEPKPRTQMGLKGITSHGQQMLRSACYLMERDYGKSDLCFATLTVPQLSTEGRRKLHSNWAELLRQLVQWVSRRLTRAGRPIKVCGCVEIQSARLERSHEGYLHLHAIWPSHSNVAGQTWAITWADCRYWWTQAIERFSGESLSHYPRVELAPVTHSAEKYMGKYLSKGSGEALDGFVADHGAENVPAAWWFMTSDLRHQIKSETARGANTGTLLNAFIQQCFREGDLTPFEWIKHVEYQHGDRAITIGWCGRLKPQWRDDLLSMMAPLIIPELSRPVEGV